MANEETRDRKETQALPEKWDHAAFLAERGRQDHRDHQEFQAKRELLDRKEIVGLLEDPVHLELLATVVQL